MIRPGTALALVLVLAGAGCAKSKSDAPPSASAAQSSTPASAPLPAGKRKLCSDGLHTPGEHWKEACNPCRCAADGEITCAQFPCGPAAARGDAGAAGDAAP